MRRGAARPAERPSTCLAEQQAVSRWQVAPPPSVMVAKRRRRCPQDTVGWPSARPLGVVARRCGRRPCLCPRVLVLGQRPASSVRCERPSSVHACLFTRPVSSVRCGRLSVQVPGVRCLVSAVRCPCVPASALSDRNEVVEGGGGGRQPPGWDGRGRRGRRPWTRPARRLPESEPGDRGWRRQCCQWRRRPGPGRRRGRWLSSG